MHTESQSEQQQPGFNPPEPVALEPEQIAAEPEPSEFNLGLIGQRLAGRYLIESPLGSGGMSLVYKGKHEAIDRTVAIKTLKMDLCSDPIILQRFEREVKGLSRLNHPNIVTVYDCVISPQGQPFIIMDYIDGESLDRIIEREKVIDPTRAVKMFMQVCQALEHAHRNGVIHRDLKPANIMLTKVSSDNEQVKVVDFGLAQLMENTQRLTSTGQLWGSAPYMSPEQCMADEKVPIDQRTDVYSLGVVIYEALTGKDPYFDSELMQTISNHIHMVPPTFKEINPEVSIAPVLEAVVFKALEKAPSDRFQSMSEFREALSYAASPLLKQEEQRHVRELQSKMEAQQQRAIKQNKEKKSNLRKAQQKERINVVPIVIATAFITLAATVGGALFLSKSMTHRSATDNSQATDTTAPANNAQAAPADTAQTTGTAAANAKIEKPPVGRQHSGQTNPIEAAAPTMKAQKGVVKPRLPAAAHSKPIKAQAPHAEHESKIKHAPVALKHVAVTAAPKPTKPAAQGANPWSTLENLHTK
jgi:serine/threonine protein kinase